MLLTPVRAGALERGLQRGVRVMGHRGPGSRQGRNTRASLPLSGLQSCPQWATPDGQQQAQEVFPAEVSVPGHRVGWGV